MSIAGTGWHLATDTIVAASDVLAAPRLSNLTILRHEYKQTLTQCTLLASVINMWENSHIYTVFSASAENSQRTRSRRSHMCEKVADNNGGKSKCEEKPVNRAASKVNKFGADHCRFGANNVCVCDMRRFELGV